MTQGLSDVRPVLLLVCLFACMALRAAPLAFHVPPAADRDRLASAIAALAREALTEQPHSNPDEYLDARYSPRSRRNIYLAMSTLAVVQSPDHCDPLPSIPDLMSSSCGTRESPTAITAGDLAFLKALYYRNTALGPSLSRAAIENDMTRQFEGR